MTTATATNEYAVLEGIGNGAQNYFGDPKWSTYETFGSYEQAESVMLQKSEDHDDSIVIFTVGKLSNDGKYEPIFDENGSEVE